MGAGTVGVQSRFDDGRARAYRESRRLAVDRGLVGAVVCAALIAVVAVAFALRVAAVLLIEVDPRARWGFDMSWYDGVARRLVAGLGCVGFDLAPTAHWPPGYPFLLAAVYWLFGP